MNFDWIPDNSIFYEANKIVDSMNETHKKWLVIGQGLDWLKK